MWDMNYTLLERLPVVEIVYWTTEFCIIVDWQGTFPSCPFIKKGTQICVYMRQRNGQTENNQTEKPPQESGEKIKQVVYWDVGSKDWDSKIVSLELD